MPKKKHFKVLRWDNLPADTRILNTYDLECLCGREAICPIADVGVNIEARLGMDFVIDPATPAPDYLTPQEIKCPQCGRIYSHTPPPATDESEGPPALCTAKSTPLPTPAACTESTICFVSGRT